MALTLDQLVTPQTSDNIRSQMVASLVSLGIPANLWRSGGVASTLLTVMAMMLASTSVFIAAVIKGFFLPLATNGGLILLAKYMYGVDAPAATFASGNVTLTNSGGANYPSQAVGSLILLNPTTQITYTNTAVYSLGPLGSAVVPVEATTIGTAGNAQPGSVTQLVTALLGVTVTNPTAILGSDAISDVALRQLCLNSLGVNSPYGPRSAYAYAIQTAINPATGNPVNVNRWTITPTSSTGVVTIVVASPSGSVSADDLAAVEANVETLARPDTVTVIYDNATAIPYTQTITVYCTVPSGVLSTLVNSTCESVLDTLFSNYPIGGEVAQDDTSSITGIFRDSVVGAIASGLALLGGVFISAKFSSPGTADLALTSTQVPSNGTTLIISIIPSTAG